MPSKIALARTRVRYGFTLVLKPELLRVEIRQYRAIYN
jgi:hypothetical protein